MLLINPPVVKPCEPPPGQAKLAGALKYHGIDCQVIDANIEGLTFILENAELSPEMPANTSIKRAHSHLGSNIKSLQSPDVYKNPDAYKQAVLDINRILDTLSGPFEVKLGLANYIDRHLSPVRSRDLIAAYHNPEKNIFHPYFEHRLGPIAETMSCKTVGISLNFLSQALCTFAMIGFLKQRNPGLRIILGGGLVTSWVRGLKRHHPFTGIVDEFIAGPGETHLLSMFGVGETKDHYQPDYDPFRYYPYLSPGFVLPYSSAGGCYWNRCSFCPEKAEGNSYLPIPVNNVMRDLEFLSAQTKPGLLHLTDNAIRPALLKAMADNPVPTPWYGFVRFTSHLADVDFCAALKASGCVMLKLGLESGDQDLLDCMNKGIDLPLVSAVLAALKKADIRTYIYLLFGTPSENYTSAKKTLDFIVRHREQIDYANLAVFNLPAYGPDAEKMDTGSFYDGDLSLYRSFFHPEGWHRNRVRQFLDKEFKRNPAVASILRKNPPVFTSNHAPFFFTEP